MEITYTTKVVMRPVSQDVAATFSFCMTLPAQTVRYVVERNFQRVGMVDGNYAFAEFHMIKAIKELRDTIRVEVVPGVDSEGGCGLGLRDAKDMISEIYNEGIVAGHYYTKVPDGWQEYVGGDDDLPF